MNSGYTTTARALHWLMALLILAAWGIGWYAHDVMPKGPERTEMFGIHKALGTVLLLLIVLRLIWRATHAPPAHALPAWMQLASRSAHGLLYFLMLALPLTGWVMSSAKGRETHFLGLWKMPDLVEKNPDLAIVFEDAHKLMATVILYLVIAHALAALHHHFVRKDGVLRGMLRG